jgi:hypothetical protein
VFPVKSLLLEYFDLQPWRNEDVMTGFMELASKWQTSEEKSDIVEELNIYTSQFPDKTVLGPCRRKLCEINKATKIDPTVYRYKFISSRYNMLITCL